MYDNQQIAERIKSQAKVRKIALKVMLNDLDLGINAISVLSKGQQMSSISLARIADYLDCSVDYLLGRTSDPESVGQKNVESDRMSGEALELAAAFDRADANVQDAVRAILRPFRKCGQSKKAM